jgi:hypothetical protein
MILCARLRINGGKILRYAQNDTRMYLRMTVNARLSSFRGHSIVQRGFQGGIRRYPFGRGGEGSGERALRNAIAPARLLVTFLRVKKSDPPEAVPREERVKKKEKRAGRGRGTLRAASPTRDESDPPEAVLCEERVQKKEKRAGRGSDKSPGPAGPPSLLKRAESAGR